MIYGWNERKIHLEKINGVCANCSENNMIAQVNQRYAHLIFIPTIPLGKATYAVCQSCGHSESKSGLPENIQSQLVRAKENSPFAWWSSIGLGGILLIAGVMGLQTKKLKGQHANYMEDIQVSDFYVFKDMETAKQDYYFGQVLGLEGDSVILRFSDYILEGGAPEFDDIRSFVLSHDDFYNDSLGAVYHSDDLRALFDSKELVKVYRNKDFAVEFMEDEYAVPLEEDVSVEEVPVDVLLEEMN